MQASLLGGYAVALVLLYAGLRADGLAQLDIEDVPAPPGRAR